MREIGVLQAKTNFSALLNAVETGDEEIVITRNGRPVATLGPVRPAPRRRLTGPELVEQARRIREKYSDLEAEAIEPFNLREAMGRE